MTETLHGFLAATAALFNATLASIFAVPVLRFFLVVPLFPVAISLAAWLTRQGQRGRMSSPISPGRATVLPSVIPIINFRSWHS